LKQYVAAKFAPRRKIITMSRPNLIIASVMIDPQMVVIQVQVGKNMVEDVLLERLSPSMTTQFGDYQKSSDS
jgi:hypothetical protein